MEETVSKAELVLNGDQWIAMAALLVTLVGSVLSFIAARESRELKRGRDKVSSTEKKLRRAFLAIQGYQDYLDGIAEEKGFANYSKFFYDEVRPGREDKFEDTEFLEKRRIEKALIKLND